MQIDPVIADGARRPDWFFHKNIVFENNEVRTFEEQVIYALSVENLVIRGNRFIETGTYPVRYPGLATIDVLHCGNVTIEGNDFSKWKDDAKISLHDCEQQNVRNDSGLPVTDSPNRYFFQY